MKTGILEEMTIDEVRELKPEVVVVPVTSTEPHGPSMPYGTDYFQEDVMCRKAVLLANKKQARILMYPTLPIGNNVNFKAFPFACRVSVRTLMLILLDIVQALEEDGIRKIVLVDGHGGNTDAMNAALREHFDKTPAESRAFVCITSGWEMASEQADRLIENASFHGGEQEACNMLYLRPDLVKSDKFQDQPLGTPCIASLVKGKINFVKPWHLFIPLSGGGDTRKATVEKGEELIEAGAKGLAEFFVELSQAKWKPGFPYSEKQ